MASPDRHAHLIVSHANEFHHVHLRDQGSPVNDGRSRARYQAQIVHISAREDTAAWGLPPISILWMPAPAASGERPWSA
jgi:hypothetical protein